MALPKIVTPEFTTTIPSSKQEITYRPFTVKEQKALLFAIESGEVDDIVRASENIIKDCVKDDIDTSKLATFDIEYIFLQIRGKSIGENLKFRLRHGSSSECQHATEYLLNIDSVKVELPDNWSNKIDIGNGFGVIMRYPSFSNMRQLMEVEDDALKMIDFACENLEMAYDDENVYDTFTPEEAEEFILGLSQEQFQRIVDFYIGTPVLNHAINYTCEQCGKDEKVILTGLKDFF